METKKSEGAIHYPVYNGCLPGHGSKAMYTSYLPAAFRGKRIPRGCKRNREFELVTPSNAVCRPFSFATFYERRGLSPRGLHRITGKGQRRSGN